MKDVSTTINYKGKEYKLVFNLNVMEAIQDEYGSIEKWGTICEPSKGEPNIKALKYGFAAMLNEGIDISNDENGTDYPPLSLKQVGRMVSELGINQAAIALSNTVVKSTKSNEKNELSTTKMK
jgi:hypothetical protein